MWSEEREESSMKRNIVLASNKYCIKPIGEEEILQVYSLCKENSQYYRYFPPFVTIDSIKQDLRALPKGKCFDDKYYIGFYQKEKLVAVMDFITEYPNKETVYIGFFMMNKKMQGKGIGTDIITEVCSCLKENGFSKVELGYVKENFQSERFWLKNHFEKTGVETKIDDCIIVGMKRYL